MDHVTHRCSRTWRLLPKGLQSLLWQWSLVRARALLVCSPGLPLTLIDYVNPRSSRDCWRFTNTITMPSAISALVLLRDHNHHGIKITVISHKIAQTIYPLLLRTNQVKQLEQLYSDCENWSTIRHWDGLMAFCSTLCWYGGYFPSFFRF